MDFLEKNLNKIKNNIYKYKQVPEVKLICVTKSVGVKEIEKLYSLGEKEFGENKVQIAREKINYIFKFFDRRDRYPESTSTITGRNHILDRVKLISFRYEMKKNMIKPLKSTIWP